MINNTNKLFTLDIDSRLYNLDITCIIAETITEPQILLHSSDFIYSINFSIITNKWSFKKFLFCELPLKFSVIKIP